MGHKSIKIFLAVILSISLAFPFKLNLTEAASDTLIKTVEFFIGQEAAVKTSGQDAGPFSFTINIPESSLQIKSAIIEVNGVSYNNSGNQTVTIDLERNSDPAGTPGYVTDHSLGVSAKPKSFKLQYDALKSGTGPMSNIVASGTPYAYTLYIKDSVSAGSVYFSIASAKLVLTYQYSASSSEVLKTTKFFIEQKTNQVASGIVINKPFAISISERSIPENTPLVRSVFLEISGTAKGNISGTIEAKVAKAGFDPGYSIYNLDLASPSCGASCVAPFIVRYDASSVVVDSDFPGNKDYIFYFRGTGFDTNLLSAKMIISYKYSEASGGLPVKGELISSTFDTWDGVRLMGAAYNSLTWKGLSGGGKVRMQIATSDNILGPWDSNTDFKGPSCTGGASDVYIMDLPDQPVEILCANIHNNKRYFRYKVILCSEDCTSAGSGNPEVMDVIVNWSP